MKVRFSITLKDEFGKSRETAIKVEETLLTLLALKFGGSDEAKNKIRELAQIAPRDVKNFSATVCNMAILEIAERKLKKAYNETYGQIDWVG